MSCYKVNLKFILSYLDRFKFLWFPGLVFIVFLLIANEGKYDYWEHLSAIKSLSEDISNPSHPFIKDEYTTHHFYSPYHLVLAFFVNIADIPLDRILIISGFINFLLFFVLFYKFISQITCNNSDFAKSSYFFSLIFILFWWGQDLWMWSGFYHFKFIREQIYMPSLVSLNLLFITLSLHISYNRKPSILAFLFSSITFCLAILIHPNTAISFIPIIQSYLLRKKSHWIKIFLRRKVLFSLTSLLLGFLLTLLWPYYSFFSFLNSSDAQYFNEDSYRFYSEVLVNCWPIFLSIPLLVYYEYHKKDIFFILSISTLCGLYIFGFISKNFGLGRSISMIMMLAQINMGIVVGAWYQNNTSFIKRFLIILFIIIAIVSVNAKFFVEKITVNQDKRTHHKSNSCKSSGRPWLLNKHIKNHIGKNEVVLTEINLGRYFAVYGGKYIAIDRPDYWISDINERREAVSLFHSNEASTLERDSIINRYNVEVIAIDKTSNSKNTYLMNYLNKNFNIRFQDDCIILFEIFNQYE